MATLNWIGKEKVINHHLDVPFRTLKHKYTYKDGQTLTDSTRSENKIIHGDNLEALKSLLPEYEGKIKCIYIDPPYNTGNEGWVYNDNVNSPKIKKWLGQVVGREGEDLTRHDKWICMMYPRLKLLHKLLRDDGVIFVSIDYHEQHYLNILLNEIFGEENYLAQLIWRGMHTVRNSAKDFNKNTEYVFCYSKNINKLIIPSNSKTYLRTPMDKSGSYTKNDNDDRGFYKLDPISARNYARPYTINFPNGVVWEAPVGSYPRYSYDNLLQMYQENKLDFNGKDPRAKRYLEKVQKGVPTSTLLPNEQVGFNKDGTSILSQIFPNIKAFDQPKPPSLIEFLFKISREIDTDDGIYLDSFAGSGTTAHAVLNLNKEDGGNRKFILIELEDYAENITAERIKRVIHGYGIDKQTEGTGGNFEFLELGDPLFGEDDYINENQNEEDIRKYVYYSETRTKTGYSENPRNDYYLGKRTSIGYYFYYKKNAVTTLDLDFASKIEIKADQYIIYADKCSLSQKYLNEHNIIFKKIPRDITRI